MDLETLGMILILSGPLLSVIGMFLFGLGV